MGLGVVVVVVVVVVVSSTVSFGPGRLSLNVCRRWWSRCRRTSGPRTARRRRRGRGGGGGGRRGERGGRRRRELPKVSELSKAGREMAGGVLCYNAWGRSAGWTDEARRFERSLLLNHRERRYSPLGCDQGWRRRRGDRRRGDRSPTDYEGEYGDEGAARVAGATSGCACGAWCARMCPSVSECYEWNKKREKEKEKKEKRKKGQKRRRNRRGNTKELGSYEERVAESMQDSGEARRGLSPAGGPG